jgi:ketosteroid isomerase-like protein
MVMLKIKWFICALYFFSSLNLKAQNKDSVAVLTAAEKFVKAFNYFDWPAFRNSFTDNATMFHPFWKQGTRRAGRKEVENTWLEVFPEFLNNPAKDSLQINPKDIHIQLYGQTAIVTFHLGNGIERLSRRTLVMIKQDKEWKIAHLHASSVSAQ